MRITLHHAIALSAVVAFKTTSSISSLPTGFFSCRNRRPRSYVLQDEQVSILSFVLFCCSSLYKRLEMEIQNDEAKKLEGPKPGEANVENVEN